MRKLNQHMMKRMLAAFLAVLLAIAPVSETFAEEIANAQSVSAANVQAEDATGIQPGGNTSDAQSEEEDTLDQIIAKYDSYEEVVQSTEYRDYLEMSEDGNDSARMNKTGGMPVDYTVEKIDAIPADTAGEENKESVPAKYTRSDNPYISTIKNQGNWGTCWAFAAMAMAESAYKKQHIEEENNEIDLSEKQFVQFFYNREDIVLEGPDGGLAGDYNKNGNATRSQQGGNFFFSAFALANWKGAADEAEHATLAYDPYETYKEQDKDDMGISKEYAYADALHLQNASWMSLNKDPNEDPHLNDDIKRAIMENGAVGIDYAHIANYTSWGRKDYDRESQPEVIYCPETTAMNHLVVVVGWDDNFDRENFKNTLDNYTRISKNEEPILPQKNGAWLIKNSWGDNYGNDGFVWISYEDGSLAERAYVYEFEPADNYDHNYQYDGAAGLYGYGDTTITGAAVFTPKNDEVVRAVGVGTGSVNTKVKVEIYTQLKDPTEPDSGTLAATTETTIKYQGYHTIELDADTPVQVNAGEAYGVVLTLSEGQNDGKQWCMLLREYSYPNGQWIEFHAESEAGQTFLKEDNIWLDTHEMEIGTLRIKAFTDDNRKLSVDRTTLILNDTKEKTATIRLEDTDENVTFTSSDENVVTVEKIDANSAKLTAVGEGTAEISAKCGRILKKVTITVRTRSAITSLRVSEDKLVFSADDCQNKEYTLVYETDPNGALSEGMLDDFSTECLQKSDAVSVNKISYNQEDNAIEVSITVNNPGRETIRATLDGENAEGKKVTFTTETSIIVKHYMNDDDVKKLSSQATDGKSLYAITNLNAATLGDVKLAKGFEWCEPDTKLEADDDEPEQYFEVECTSEAAEEIENPILWLPVCVTTLKGVSMTGKSVVGVKKGITKEAVLSVTGYFNLDDDDFLKLLEQVTYSWTCNKPSVLSIREDTEAKPTVSVNGVAKGDAKLTLTATAGDKQWSAITTATVKVTAKDYLESITIEEPDYEKPYEGIAKEKKATFFYNVSANTIEVDYEQNKLDDKNVQTNLIGLTALNDEGKSLDKSKITWSVADKAIADISTLPDGSGKLTIKAAGRTRIYATVKDENKAEDYIDLIVADYAPKLMSNELTVYQLDQKGVQLPVAEQNENTITDISFSKKDIYGKEYFTIEGNKDDGFWLKAKSKSNEKKNKTIKVRLAAKTQKQGPEQSSDYELGELTVKLITSAPKVTFKNIKKANFFYSSNHKGTEKQAQYVLSSEIPIKDVRVLLPESKIGFDGRFDNASGVLTLVPQGLTDNTVKNYDKKVSLQVTFEDEKVFNYTIKSVATTVKKPGYVIDTVAPVMRQTGTLQERVAARVSDKATKQTVSMNNMTIKLAPNNPLKNVTPEIKDGKLWISGYVQNGHMKTGTYKVVLTSPDFTDSLTLSGKLAKSVRSLTTKLSGTTVTWNTKNQEKGAILLPVSFKESAVDVIGIRAAGKSAKESKLLGDKVIFGYDKANRSVSVEVKDSIDPGTYRFNITGISEFFEVTAKSQVLTLKVVNSNLALAVKAKGSINLADRKNSGIVMTPRITNDTACIQDIQLDGADKQYFEITDKQYLEDGTTIESFKIVAKSGYRMEAKKNYVVNLKAVCASAPVKSNMENPKEIVVELKNYKIKPTCKYPKVTATVTKSTLYKSSSKNVEFAVYAANAAPIKTVALEKNKYSEYFEISSASVSPGNYSSQIVTISLREDKKALLKSGTYTLKYRVIFEDNASNVKAAAKTVRVLIK